MIMAFLISFTSSLVVPLGYVALDTMLARLDVRLCLMYLLKKVSLSGAVLYAS